MFGMMIIGKIIHFYSRKGPDIHTGVFGIRNALIEIINKLFSSK